MSWCELQGHDQQVEYLRRSLRRGRLASTFLFVGPAGIGKFTFAKRFAQGLLCETNRETELNPCRHCDACQQIDADSHPDLLQVHKPADRSSIPLESFVGPRDNRMREGFCHDIRLKPFSGKRRVGLINDADFLNEEGANSLLKTLEEPPPRAVIILIGTSLQRQLPTIRSRCQVLRFTPLADEFIAKHVLEQEWIDSETQAADLAAIADGSLDRAQRFADPDLLAFRDELWSAMRQPKVDSVQLARRINQFVDAAGKETRQKRDRLRMVLHLAVHHFRQAMHDGCAHQPDTQVDNEQLVEWLERSLECQSHVEANGNVSTIIDCWIDDLFGAPR